MPTLACAVALGLCFGGNAAADDPDPGAIYIDSFAYAGSGCPPGTVFVDLAPGGQAFTVIYGSFTAERGPGYPLSASRKNCQLNVTVHVPQGFSYAIAAADHRGSANIAARAKGLQKATYYYAGQVPYSTTWRLFDGPYNDEWYLHDEVEPTALIWTPCGAERSLNVNTQTRLEKGSSDPLASSFMNMERQTYHLLWRTCTE